jgi:hypothetical protein
MKHTFSLEQNNNTTDDFKAGGLAQLTTALPRS